MCNFYFLVTASSFIARALSLCISSNKEQQLHIPVCLECPLQPEVAE